MKTITLIFLFTTASWLLQPGPSPMDTRLDREIRITSPINGDIYLAGRTIIIDAPIRGDLVAAGGSIIINDSIAADALLAGGEISINGPVGDDIRAAGGTLEISNDVSGDVLVSGGEIILKKDAKLHGNLSATGNRIEIFGDVMGSVTAAGELVDLGGSVDGSLDARAKKIDVSGALNGYAVISANTIDILPEASFKKDVRYWNDDGSIDISTDNIKVAYDPSVKVEQPRWELIGFSSVLMVLWYLGTALVVIWVIEYLFSKTLLNAAGVALEKTIGSIGYGIAFFIGVPAFCLGLGLTVLALPIAVILAIAYVIVVVLATVITAVVISNWINKVYYHSSWKVSKVALVAFGIFIALKFFTLTPFIGPVLMIIIACMAMGALTISVWRSRFKDSAKPG